MNTNDILGMHLRHFRTRLGGIRHEIEWLAHQLNYPPSTLYGWENGDPSKGVPSRDILLRIGRWYSLDVDEVDMLIAACRAKIKRPSKAACYTPLSADERAEWRAVIGPLMHTIRVWEIASQTATQSYLQGELRSAKQTAQRLVDDIWETMSEECSDSLWNRDERDELTRLWLLGWRQLYEASVLLFRPSILVESLRPYSSHARELAAGTDDPLLIALVSHVEGDLQHIQGNARQAMDRHQEVAHVLGRTGKRSDTYLLLAALTQRLLILDGVTTLPQVHLSQHMLTGRRMADALAADHPHLSALLLEAIGRSLAVAHDPTWRSILDEAEARAKGRAPVSYVTALYSRMIGLVGEQRGTDVDELRTVATTALAIAEHSNWVRRVDQIHQAAEQCGLQLLG